MTTYYNEFEPYAAQWLRNLIDAGLIAHGHVDSRSIVDVRPDDLAGFTQCHFFAGIGGWSLAARLAGWPDDRPLWTGSCPCQPFSIAGKRTGQADARHLWPEFHRLIAGCRPDVVMGEQVAAAVGKDWLDGVYSDLEVIDYACGAAVVPACAVDAPHRRDRLWFVADTKRCDGHGRPILAQRSAEGRTTDWRDGPHDGSATLADTNSRQSFWWSGPLQVGWNSVAGQTAPGGDAPRTQWRVKPGLPLLAHGISGRVDQLRAFGNAIVPQVAAEIIGAYMDCAPWPPPCPVPPRR